VEEVMSEAGRRLSVLVVDDSAVVRTTLTTILSQEPDLSVASAADPLIAQGKIARERPDVIVLDLEMPRMDGLTFLRALMASDPIPVVICSGLTVAGAQHAMRALEEGAVSIVTKPKIGVREFLYESAVTLVDAVRAAAQAKLLRRGRGPAAVPRAGAAARRAVCPPEGAPSLIAIGASAGGTEALRVVLQGFPEAAPATVVVQHMPETFTATFAARLDSLCAVEVREARDGDAVQPGRVLIAPGNRHLRLRRRGAGYAVEVADGPLVSRHRPSVDVLFRSVAEAAGPSAVGALLTGMGVDGAEGLLEMRTAGARTIAQDEASCVVFGMPKEAIALGAAQLIVPLADVAATVLGGRVPAAAANVRV
jgi:two-component system, chemotaxis family, protein-glutamate methylesterase/glutaminase